MGWHDSQVIPRPVRFPLKRTPHPKAPAQQPGQSLVPEALLSLSLPQRADQLLKPRTHQASQEDAPSVPGPPVRAPRSQTPPPAWPAPSLLISSQGGPTPSAAPPSLTSGDPKVCLMPARPAATGLWARGPCSWPLLWPRRCQRPGLRTRRPRDLLPRWAREGAAHAPPAEARSPATPASGPSQGLMGAGRASRSP